MIKRRKILAIASIGGHWIQLMRLRPAFSDFEVIYVSTNRGCRHMVSESKFYEVKDSSRWSKARLFITFFQVFYIIVKEWPKVVVTTGAAPGLMGILIGSLFRLRTIWIDSVANTEMLSLSGRISTHLASRVYSQWPEVASKNEIYFAGNVLE